MLGTDAFRAWYDGLEDDAAFAVNAAVDRLEQDGPALGEPLVKRIARPAVAQGRRLHNLKELRVSVGGHRLRVLFVFDPARKAVLLVGGDKTGRWAEWYRESIPAAEALYTEYLRNTREE